MPDASNPSRPDGVYGPRRRPYRTVSRPACGSPNIQTKNHAKKLGGALGTCAGVISAFNGAAKGAAVGASMAFRFTPALGLLNTITEFVDHERRAHNTDNRLDSAWFGHGAAIKQQALDRTLAMLA